MAETGTSGDRASHRIPAFVNQKAGSADKASKAIEADAAFELLAVAPERLQDEIRSRLARGATRILIAGGDGTVRSAASAVVHSAGELAVLPGGTLNHFAKDHDVPLEADEALALARSGTPSDADAGFANDKVFLNTSTIGAYVLFARTRERYEKYIGYYLASVVAGIRILARLPVVTVEIEVNGERKRYETPMLFVGVGERELKLPEFGSRVDDGQRLLHVMVVRSRSSARLLAVGLAAATRGVRWLSRTPELDSFLVERCGVEFLSRKWEVAVDGEIESYDSPLSYRIERGALRVIAGAAPAQAG